MTKETRIKSLLKEVPDSPGVYRMLDKDQKVIYIGKAKSLKKRVKQYFQKNYHHSTRTEKLLEKLEDIKYTAVDSELEAMILEVNQIKQYKPKYNVIMKDDKNYVYIKITDEDFPIIQIVRKVEKDNATYFGPKTAAHKVKETLKTLKTIAPFRHCNLGLEAQADGKVLVTKKTIKYPCLDFYIKRCAAPCISACSKEEYKELIVNIENFFKGKADGLVKSLETKMKMHAEKREFEKALKMRDKIAKIKSILEKQNVHEPNQEDKDIINYLVIHETAYFNLFQIRAGKLINQENFILSAKETEENTTDHEVLEAFMLQYYEIATDIPREILIPHEIEDTKVIEEHLNFNKSRKAKIVIPKIGSKNKLLEMSLKNAKIYADRNKPSWREESKITENATAQLQKLLNLKTKLNRIECYDISHLGGTETVGSMIVFTKGVPDKAMYRKFKLRTLDNKIDDFKSMEEALTRRFLKLTEQIKSEAYKFRKATKKDIPFIEKNNDIQIKDSTRSFYLLQKGKTNVGFIGVNEISPKVTELTNLWLEKKERGNKFGYKLVRNAINKAKSKRVYGLCKPELKDYYLLFGFEEVKKVPDELLQREKECERRTSKKPICIVFDKTKHKEDKSFTKVPDLVLIDGGKGQLSSAGKVFKKLNLNIPYISLAKQFEEIYTPTKKTPIRLERNDEALKLLQRARNEAHRFAITYNKNLRAKNIFNK